MKIVNNKFSTTIPQVSDDGSAGYDFFMPLFDGEFKKQFKKLNNGKETENTKLIIYPGEVVKIPTGIKVKMKRFRFLNFFFSLFGIQIVPKFQAYDKSSLASKGLSHMAGLIDYSYRGEIIAVVTNVSRDGTTIELKQNKKFIQFVQEFALITKPKIVSDIIYRKKYTTERGEGGFGSTDKK